MVKENWNHQYAAALYDAWTNAKYLQKGCVTNNEAAITFSVPVFADMPETACPAPSVVVIPEPTPPPPPEPVIKKGDPNDDGVVDVVDLAIVKMHILEMNKLEKDSKNFKASDVNGDGEVDVVDLAAIKMDILEIRKIG